MKYLFFLLTCSVLFSANAQKSDSTTIKAVFGSTNSEMQELMGFLGVERFHVELDDPKLAGKYFHLISQEFRNGIAQPEQDMFGFARRKEPLQFDQTGKLAFDVYARAVDPTTIEAFFKLPRVSQRKTYKVEADDSRRYSFRTDILSYKNQKTVVPIGQRFPFLVHTLPYDKDGFSYYCTVAQSRVPVADWYKQFGVKHFIAYQLVLE
ncbi:hypothetical protein [Spirosoma lituiforme]